MYIAPCSKNDAAKARRAAKREGLIARKPRGRLSSDNYGGFQLLDQRNRIVAGVKCDLSAQDVIDYCNQ